MRGKKVPEELKIKIIEESLSDGCVVGELARRYNLTSKTINSWRSAYIKLRSSSKFTKDLVNNTGEFMELPVAEDIICNSTSHSNLQSVSLKFNNFSIEMEGKIKISALVSIISILEESC